MSGSLVVLLVAIVAFWIGWFLRDLRDQIVLLKAKVKFAKAKGEIVESLQPRSSIVEPKTETPGERAKREQEELLERLNRG